ncbi:hypothetical protein JCM10450v2_004574 [Rhodotorula kratochvilovae]
MGASPFRRRPALARTYGSSHPSSASASTNTATYGRRASAHAGRGARAQAKEEESSTEEDGDEVPVAPPKAGKASKASGSGTVNGNGGKGKGQPSTSAQASAPSTTATAPAPRPSPARRTRSTSSAAGALKADAEGSTLWDETAALVARPVAPKRRASARLAGATAEDGAEELPAAQGMARSPSKRRSEGAPASSIGAAESEVSRASPPKKRRLSTPLAARTKQDDMQEDDIPAPFDYVPLAERLKRASPPKPSPPLKPAAAAPAPAPAPIPAAQPQPQPLLRRTRSSSRLAAGSPPPTPSTSTAPPPPPARPASPLRRSTISATSAIPRPASPLRRTTSARLPAASPRKPTNAPAVRPPSPAKDLSAIFSRFAPPAAGPSAAQEADPAARPRMLLKRSQSSGGAAAGSNGGAGLRAEMLSRKRGTGEVLEEQDEEAVSGSPTRPRTLALDRSLSYPTLPSSPLSSPGPGARSPARPALGASLSFPALSGSPSRGGVPNPFSREASPSPARPAGPAPLGAGTAALGSAYRPVAFAPPAANFAAAGPTRTYAGGARTLRRDVAEEALFAAPSSSASSSASASAGAAALPSLPPSLSRRTRPAQKPEQDLSTLRALWGIDAEDALADSEEADSQDRGARVVGGGLLRKQGEGKRWMDEIGWCLEGLRAGERGAVRASALDLLTKLLSRDWLRRLKSSGQAETVYLAFRLASSSSSEGAPDRVLDTAFAALLALLLRDQRMAEPLFRLRAADVQREEERLRAARDGADDEESAPPAAAQSDGAPGAGWSSSPRKAGAGGVDERCDLLEVLRELGAREWAREEVGSAQSAGEEEGAARAKGKKVLRGDARHLQSLRDIITSAELFPSTSGDAASSSTPITLRTLVLHATRSIAGFAPRAIFQPQHMLCESSVFDQVASTFLDECKSCRGRVESYETGLDLLPPPGHFTAISLPTISMCLSIFESTSLATPYAYHVISLPDILPQLAAALGDLALVAFLLALDAPPTEVPAPTRKEAMAVLTAAPGVLFGLTTERAWGKALVGQDGGVVSTLVRVVLACRRVAAAEAQNRDGAGATALVRSAADASSSGADAEMPRSSEREDEDEDALTSVEAQTHAVWDVLSLALGVLANLAESADEELRVQVRELRLDSSCHGKRKCARECRCAAEDDGQAQTALELLARLALDPLADAPNSVYQHSITGFLRLLLGLLILDSPQNEDLVLGAFGDTPGALAPVLDALDGLAGLHDEQRRAREAMALPVPPAEGADEEEGWDSQRTEVEGAEGDTVMDEVGAQGAAEEGEDLPRRMRELVQRLRRRVA